MRHLKILGLAVMAAVAVMAVGAATSSATVFCKNNASTSTCSEKYPVGTEVVATSEGSSSLETLGGTVLDTCSSVEVKEELGSEGSSTTTIQGSLPISAVTWSGCTKATTMVEGGEGEVHWISGTDNGTITGKGGGVTTNSAFGSCVYGLGGGMDLGEVVGGKHPSLSINRIVVKVSGGATCPVEVRVTGKAVLTSPEVGYVTSG